MHRTALRLIPALLAVWGATVLGAAPVIMLSPPNVAFGPPGATVGWGFTITNNTNYIEITSAQFCDSPVNFPLGCNAPSNGTFTDFISQFHDIIVGPPDGTVSNSVTQPFNAAAHEGVGSFRISPSAIPGATDVGEIVLTYNEYDADPILGPFNLLASDQVLGANAGVTVTGSIVVPEPATAALVAVALAALAGRRLRRPRSLLTSASRRRAPVSPG